MENEDKEKKKEKKQSAGKKASLEKLRQEIEELQKEKDELFEKLQRVSADYANFQKRAPKQITDSVAYEKEKIIKMLLPALDNFEHTLQSASSAENAEVLIKGIQIIYDQMIDILKLYGVQQVVAVGEKFDPSQHQAMMQKTDEEKEEGVVLEEFQKGYTLNGRVIRPSKVVVNNLSLNQEPEPEGGEQEGEELEAEQ
jgi:molecular chaperone GrpE